MKLQHWSYFGHDPLTVVELSKFEAMKLATKCLSASYLDDGPGLRFFNLHSFDSHDLMYIDTLKRLIIGGGVGCQCGVSK